MNLFVLNEMDTSVTADDDWQDADDSKHDNDKNYYSSSLFTQTHMRRLSGSCNSSDDVDQEGVDVLRPLLSRANSLQVTTAAFLFFLKFHLPLW